jgi:phosphoserine phosphatase
MPSEKQWRSLLEISRRMAATADIEALLTMIANTTVSLLDCERASVFLHDAAKGELWTRVALQADEIRMPAGAGIAGLTFSENRVVVVPAVAENPLFNREVDRRTGFTTRNLLAAPMVDIQGRPVGVIEAINRRAGTFGEGDGPLIQLLADQAGVAVQRHRYQVEALAAAEMQHEMALARRLQQSMLPARMPEVRGLEGAFWSATASSTGGDAFDLFRLANGQLGILVADAAGHGLAPALVVSQVRSLVRALAEEMGDWQPGQILEAVNRRVGLDFPASEFVTAFLGVTGGDGELRWTSAGHGPVVARVSRTGPFVELEPPHTPLGVEGTWSEARTEVLRMEAGGMLVIPSDGIIEAPNAGGECFTLERVLAILEGHGEASCAELVQRIREGVQVWQGGAGPKDDQTLVIVRWG